MIRKHKFEYTICNGPDEDIFERQCKALEDNIPDLKKGELLIDVDSSKYQIYSLYDKSVIVSLDFELMGVNVDSDIELRQFFK